MKPSKPSSQGADDIDYVINITALKAKDYSYIMKKMEQICSILQEKRCHL